MIGYEAYDRLAPHYRRYSAGRSAYLAAIDRYIEAHAKHGGRLLDIGSADGVRAVQLGRALSASRIVLCEPSPRMVVSCRQQPVDAVWQTSAQALPETDERFEVITCLWNVLGHLPDRAARIQAFTRMRQLLAPSGTIFCDVNNRHNARAYGFVRVLLRRMLDTTLPDDRRGDSAFEWDVGSERIATTGHLFTPKEMGDLIRAAGLLIEERLAIDYVTGARSSAPWDGQLLYRLAAYPLPSGGAIQ